MQDEQAPPTPQELQDPSAAAGTTQRPPFPNKYYLWLILPFVIGLLGMALTSTGGSEGALALVTTLLSLSAIGYVYYVQASYLKQFYPQNKVQHQLISFVFAIAIPTITAVAGDTLGATKFSNNPTTGTAFIAGIVVGLVVGAAYLLASILGNALFIHTKGQSSAVAILRGVFYGIGCLLAGIISFALYGFAYTLHDPSTE